jgi:undecaprenyl-phosphate 4-deoxy-4-formamido-L-arabinose transferase
MGNVTKQQDSSALRSAQARLCRVGVPRHNPHISSDPSALSAAGHSYDLELSIVVPVYRSEECLPALVRAIALAMAPLSREYEIILVNDCSPDNSWYVIESLCAEYPNLVGIDLRRNFGQDNALITGFRFARGRYVAIMDDDLQHDPCYLPGLLAKLEEGFDVVYASFRQKRQKLWKNLGSWLNGKGAEWVLSKPKHIYLSPYKVVRKEIIDLVCNHRGAEPYIDGLLLQLTSRLAQIEVEHRARHAGNGNYTLWKSIRLWGRVMFSFSVRPLRIVSVLGCVSSVSGLMLAIVVILYRILDPQAFGPEAIGWASLMVVMLFLGGLQMTFFGIVGEYVGRTYLRVNEQPQTAVRAVLGNVSRFTSLGNSAHIRNEQAVDPVVEAPVTADNADGHGRGGTVWRQA